MRVSSAAGVLRDPLDRRGGIQVNVDQLGFSRDWSTLIHSRGRDYKGTYYIRGIIIGTAYGTTG